MPAAVVAAAPESLILRHNTPPELEANIFFVAQRVITSQQSNVRLDFLWRQETNASTQPL